MGCAKANRSLALTAVCFGALATPAGALAASHPRHRPSPRFLSAVPKRPIGGGTTGFTGSVVGAPDGSRVTLEQRRASHHWSVIAVARVDGGSFQLQWPVAEVSSLTVRLTLARGGRRLARTAPSTVHPRTVFVEDCSAPTPPASVPAGDGWVTGGVYTVGGPAPGVDVCRGAGTVTVISQSGLAVASTQVPEGSSYTIVLPVGSYNLTVGSSNECLGTATVTASRETKANTICSVP